MKWEYTMTYLKFDTKIRTKAKLNEMGEKGWEFTTFQGDYGVFKRPVKKPFRLFSF